MNNYIFYFFYNLGQSYSWLVDLALFISYKLIYIVILFLFISILIFPKRKMYSFSLFFLTGFSSFILARILKFIFQIPRPFDFLNLVPFYREVGYSFPSEHMTIFSALAMVSYFLNKKIGVVFIFFAFIVGLSRIVLGVHYPVDILAGFIVGYLIANFYIKFFKKI